MRIMVPPRGGSLEAPFVTKKASGRKDWIIREQVQRDARVSFAELGRRAGLSAPAAAERLRRLEDAGVVRGYRTDVAPERLGLEMAVLIEMHVPRPSYARFQKAVEKLPGIRECHHISGRAVVHDAGRCRRRVGAGEPGGATEPIRGNLHVARALDAAGRGNQR